MGKGEAGANLRRRIRRWVRVMPAEEVSAAIALRARDYSESDRIVTLLTREYGKLGGIAKGARKSRVRFERKLEPFSHVMLYFRRRPNGQLVFITRAEAAELPQFNLDDDLGRFALGSYMLELAEALTSEEAEAAGAYGILTAALATLCRHTPCTAVRQAFELRMLAWAGYGLEFGRCRTCRAAIEANGPAGILRAGARRGGVLAMPPHGCGRRLQDRIAERRRTRASWNDRAGLNAARRTGGRRRCAGDRALYRGRARSQAALAGISGIDAACLNGVALVLLSCHAWRVEVISAT